MKACAVGMPDVFTRVDQYVDWIDKEITKYNRYKKFNMLSELTI